MLEKQKVLTFKTIGIYQEVNNINYLSYTHITTNELKFFLF